MSSNILKKFFEWPEWESIMHLISMILGLYILYLFFNNNKNINLTNLLLIEIIIVIETLVHQNINKRNINSPNYNV